MKGILFDFNGTLFWDSPKNDKAWQQFALNHTGQCMTEEALLTLHGLPNTTTLEHILNRTLAPDEVSLLSEEKERIYRALCLHDPAGMNLAPGAPEMLNALKASGIPYTIATSADNKNLDFYYEYMALDNWFDRKLIVCSDGKLPGKPAPDFYLEAARRLCLDPRDLIVCEDSSTGIASALSAGIGRVVHIIPPTSSTVERIEGCFTWAPDFVTWRDWFR